MRETLMSHMQEPAQTLFCPSKWMCGFRALLQLPTDNHYRADYFLQGVCEILVVCKNIS